MLDTETTGLVLNRTVRQSAWPELIEFADTLVDLDSGEQIDQFATLVKPRRALDPKIAEITKITDELLGNQPTFDQVAEEIRSRIEHVDVDLVVAHNASFDVEILDMEFERLGQKIIWPRVLCTVEQTVSLRGYRLSLSALHEHLFGLEHEDAHRASTDVRALVRIVRELRVRNMI